MKPVNRAQERIKTLFNENTKSNYRILESDTEKTNNPWKVILSFMYKDFIEHRNGTGTKLNCECGGVGVWDETWDPTFPVV